MRSTPRPAKAAPFASRHRGGTQGSPAGPLLHGRRHDRRVNPMGPGPVRGLAPVVRRVYASSGSPTHPRSWWERSTAFMTSCTQAASANPPSFSLPARISSTKFAVRFE